jgi:hypothetical protein
MLTQAINELKKIINTTKLIGKEKSNLGISLFKLYF